MQEDDGASPSLSPITESLSAFSSQYGHALSLRSLSFEQVEHRLGLALQTTDTLAALRKYRNSLLPVGNLPPELLSRIFEFAVATTYPPADTAVNISRVSSSWRHIAIASSQLWSCIIDDEIKWPSRPKTFLHRSRNSYLHVYIALPDPLQETSVWPTIVRHHSDRVRDLYIAIDRLSPISDFLDAISVTLPSLEFLAMCALEGISFLPLDQYLCPPMILGGDTSHLKAMLLGPHAPFIPGNSFPSLVNLKLTGMGRGVHVTTSILIDLLSNCSHLETFDLRFRIPDLVHDNQQSTNRPPLSLNHLKALWMSNVSATSAFGLLTQLTLPAITTVRLTNLAANEFSVPQAARPLALPLAHLGLTQLDILEGGKHTGPETPFELHFIAHGPGTDLRPAAPRTGLWIHLSFWRPRNEGTRSALVNQYTHEERVFWDVLHALPTRAITALRMSTLHAAHLERAAQIIGGEDHDDGRGQPAMPLLESVVVRSLKAGSENEQRETMAYLARALFPHGLESESRVDAPGGLEPDGRVPVLALVPVPYLKELTIELNRAWKEGMGDLLVCALQERKAKGYPMHSVACSALSVGDPELEGRMREHVTGDVKVTERKLWEIRKVPEVWMVKNDYWRLYPESLARTVNGWGLPENT